MIDTPAPSGEPSNARPGADPTSWQRRRADPPARRRFLQQLIKLGSSLSRSHCRPPVELPQARRLTIPTRNACPIRLGQPRIAWGRCAPDVVGSRRRRRRGARPTSRARSLRLSRVRRSGPDRAAPVASGRSRRSADLDRGPLGERAVGPRGPRCHRATASQSYHPDPCAAGSSSDASA